MNNLEKAKNILSGSEYTCVICNDTDVHTSTLRGVAPLIKWLDSGMKLTSYSSADKVIGNGAAFLYVLLNVREVYAGVISKSAYKTLTQNNIPVQYDVMTEIIRNRSNTGQCPIEAAVSGITEPSEALSAIRNKLEDLKKAAS
ncbi:MAG: DUF1893 domain-containing protein [Ruminococcus sp.]|nr:DUF1893 domain-containing protein [Ruminococcus sp.]